METTEPWRSCYRAVRRLLVGQGSSRPAGLGGRREPEGLGTQRVLGFTCRKPDGETKARDLGPQTRASERQFCHITHLHGSPFTVRDEQGSGPVTGPFLGQFSKSAVILKAFLTGMQTKSHLDVQHVNNCPG